MATQYCYYIIEGEPFCAICALHFNLPTEHGEGKSFLSEEPPILKCSNKKNHGGILVLNRDYKRDLMGGFAEIHL